MTEFENTVSNALKDCPAGTIFLAAVSGGADSMAMLAALSGIVCGERLFCLHVEHGLRPAEESCGDAEYVRNFCEKTGIDCRVVPIPSGKIETFAHRKGIGIEAAARHFRHRALFREAERLGKNTRILIAHTRDDMLELALMRVLRGAGPAGLSAMPVSRGRILRPLLTVNRADVIAYLIERKIPWREDATNTDEKYLRNRIRHRLIPLLEEFFPDWKSGLTGMAKTQSLTAAFLAKEARRIIWEPCPVSHSAKPALAACEETFFDQPQIIREEALFQGINLLKRTRNETRGEEENTHPSLQSPRRSVIRHFCKGSVTAIDLGTLRIRRKGGKITLSPIHKDFSESGFSLLIKEPGLYNLNSISIDVPEGRSPDGFSPDGNNGFFAALPLVFRRSFNDDFLVSNGRKITRRGLTRSGRVISAVDASGTAAFLDRTGVLFVRDVLPETCGMIPFITVRNFI